MGAQATEIQPPELGAGATDNMDTIQQREGGPAADQDEQDEF